MGAGVCACRRAAPPCLQGIGIDDILEAIVKRIPAPRDTRNERLRALIFDSYYDAYKVLAALPGACQAAPRGEGNSCCHSSCAGGPQQGVPQAD